MRSRTKLLTGGAALVAVAAVAAAAIGFGGAGQPAEPVHDRLPPATAEVTAGDLTQTQSVNGTLSYGTATTLATRTDGTVTWMAAPGEVVTAGHPVYKVDNEAVLLLDGTIPPYRALYEGLSGPDVAQLEANLAAFGYTGFDVDDDYGWGTTSAVYQWQKDHGMPQTGQVTPAQIVVAAGAIRIGEQQAPPGAQVSPGSPVLSYTGTSRMVQIALAIDKQQYVTEGNPATILLPDGTSVEGTVASIGNVATTQDDGTTTIPVTVTVADQADLGAFDTAPVSLTLTTGQVTDVLVVPVTALVALSGGGFGVQVVTGEQVEYVPVQTGMFAGGRVEITGDGIAAGTTVGVAQ